MGEFLKHLLSGQHQFASDGLLLMLVGGVGVYLRAIPERLWAWIVDQCTMQMTVKDEDAAFVWVKEWFLEQKFLSRMRRVDLDTTLRDEQPALVPAQGRHWFWHAGRPFVVYLYRTDEKKRYTERRTEWLTFVTLGRRQAFVKAFVQAIVKMSRSAHCAGVVAVRARRRLLVAGTELHAANVGFGDSSGGRERTPGPGHRAL